MSIFGHPFSLLKTPLGEGYLKKDVQWLEGESSIIHNVESQKKFRKSKRRRCFNTVFLSFFLIRFRALAREILQTVIWSSFRAASYYYSKFCSLGDHLYICEATSYIDNTSTISPRMLCIRSYDLDLYVKTFDHLEASLHVCLVNNALLFPVAVICPFPIRIVRCFSVTIELHTAAITTMVALMIRGGYTNIAWYVFRWDIYQAVQL